MINEEIKEELIKRYKFIYENTLFILAPYMEEMEKTEYKSLDVKTFIYLKTLPIELLLLIEFFLLSDIKMEESSLYRFIEIHKNDNEYLKQYKKGLELLERKNQRYEELKLILDCFYLLKLLYEFISNQTGDIKKDADFSASLIYVYYNCSSITSLAFTRASAILEASFPPA